MDAAQLRVPARYYARLADVLVSEQIDLARLLREVRLPADALTQPDATLSLAQVERLLAAVQARCPRGRRAWWRRGCCRAPRPGGFLP